jgi:CMP-N-acetylneuraminic acid synthetase
VVVALVPLRGGSKTIPHKNLRLFCGRPLAAWAISALAGVRDIEETHAATDSIAIERMILGLNLPRVEVFRRSAKNAQDASPTEALMLEFIESRSLAADDTLVLAQATSPMTRAVDLARALATYRRTGADSLVACVRAKIFLWDEEGRPLLHDYRKRPRRQDFKGYLKETGAFYISSVGRIVEHANRLSGSVLPFELPEYQDCDLDSELDWIRGESVMRFVLENGPPELCRY